MRRLLAAVFAVALFGCSSSDTGTLNRPPDSGSSDGGGGSDSGGSDSQGGPVDSGGPMGDGGLAAGDPCDPAQDLCPAPLLCCMVTGNPREGGVLFACMHPRATDGGC